MSHLNSILMFSDCVGDRLALDVVLKYCSVFLSELGHQGFVAFLVID